MIRLKVALAGNPNVGKTSILNHLAGTNLKVGNWPGVTVEKKEGKVSYKDYKIEVVDLPGIYTLEPVSDDEWVAYNYLTQEKPDLVVNVIESPNMERDLLLTIKLLELEIPMVIALSMTDEAQKLGIEIDKERLEELLGVPAVKVNGRTGEGVGDLIKAIIKVYENKLKPKPITYSQTLESYILKGSKTGKESKGELIRNLSKEIRESIEKTLGRKFEDLIKEERFALAHGLYNEVFKRKPITVKDITEALDKVFLHPYLGLLSFLLIMFFVFKIAIDFSAPFMDWLDGFINNFLGLLLNTALTAIGVSDVLKNFLVEAFVGGVGFVLTFVPLIATLYILLILLEFSGYLPRVAFIMDRFMHRIGLHGKSVIPLLLGFGCNVPAIMATRTMDSKRDKFLVISMIPFMSCPARLVVFAFFAVTFFKNPTVVIFSLYVFGILVALITAFLLRNTLLKGSLSHFIMELPPYRLPTLKITLRLTWAHIKDFLYRAGTLIFAANIVIWLLLNLPPGVENPKDSLAGKLGHAITPIFKPIGIDDWRMSTSLIPAFLAREIVLANMATIYAVEGREETKEEMDISKAFKEQMISLADAFKTATLSVINPVPQAFQVEEEEDTQNLRKLIANRITPSIALSFMTFLLIYNSCLGTFGVMWKEAGKKFAIAFLLYSFIAGWFLAFVVYHISKLWIT